MVNKIAVKKDTDKKNKKLTLEVKRVRITTAVRAGWVFHSMCGGGGY
jgi:hypothetical protein